MTDPIRERAARNAHEAAQKALGECRWADGWCPDGTHCVDCPDLLFLGDFRGVNAPVPSKAWPAWAHGLVVAIAMASMLVAGVGVYRALVLADRQIEIAGRV